MGVRVYDLKVYQNPKNMLFMFPKERPSAGFMIKETGEISSVHAQKGCDVKIGPLLEKYNDFYTHLDAGLSREGKLVGYYGKHAQMRPYCISDPLPGSKIPLVFMVRDPQGVTGLPLVKTVKEWQAIRKTIPFCTEAEQKRLLKKYLDMLPAKSRRSVN